MNQSEIRDPLEPRNPVVAAVLMGYGHLRAAHALAGVFGVPVLRADAPPLAGPWETRLWDIARTLYDGVSRSSRKPVLGRVAGSALNKLTAIPEGEHHPKGPGSAVALQEWMLRRGLGRGLAAHWEASGRPLVTPYFTTAQAAAHLWRSNGAAGMPHLPVYCVVTDVDLARAWAPADTANCSIHYLAPAGPAARRLRSYGVGDSHIHRTGFPLPGGLLGEPGLSTRKRHFASRLRRLDAAGTFRRSLAGSDRETVENLLTSVPENPRRRPPLLTFAVGGAGAQDDVGAKLLALLAPALHGGRLRLTLAVGTHTGLGRRYERLAEAHGLHPVTREPTAAGEVEILAEGDLTAAFDRFHRRLAVTDLLWTKPSELTFFAALGLPLLLTRPLGVQEQRNAAWLRAHDAAVPAPRLAGGDAAGRLEVWLHDRLRSGELARLAWNGYRRLPAGGLYRIRELVRCRDS